MNRTFLLAALITVGLGGCVASRTSVYFFFEIMSKYKICQWGGGFDTCLDQLWKSNQTTVKLKNDTLWVSGKGVMADYDYCAFSEDWAPWYGACGMPCNFTITDVVIENGVTHIGNFAFCGLKRLKSITISASVRSIGKGAFYSSDSLTSITVAANNAHYVSEDGTLFNKNKTVLIWSPPRKLSGTYTIPDHVITIGEDVFGGCANLTSVIIPNSTAYIDDRVFSRCTVLTSITVADDNARYSSVDGVLFNKTKDTLIHYPRERPDTHYTIPNSVTSIGNKTFWNRKNLTSVTIPASVTSIGDFAFQGSGLTSVTIPSSVTSIGNGAFLGCTSLTSVTFEEGVTIIGSYIQPLFLNCHNLTSVTIPSSAIAVEIFAFSENNANLTSVTSLSPVPPNLMRITLFNDVSSNACLYVPEGSIDAYRADEGWSYFNCIKDLESAPKGE
jgi:hypothetical protein